MVTLAATAAAILSCVDMVHEREVVRFDWRTSKGDFNLMWQESNDSGGNVDKQTPACKKDPKRKACLM